MQGKETKEKDCMSFEGFAKSICLDFKGMFPEAEVKIQELVKVNDVKRCGLAVRKENAKVSPIIYLERFYDEYLEGKGMEEIEQDILMLYQEDVIPCDVDTDLFRDWDTAKKKIVFGLIGMEFNREYLKKIPYVQWLDMAVVFRYFLESEEFGSASIPVCNYHLKKWGITVEELYQTAVENTPKLLPPVIQSMGELIGNMIGAPSCPVMPDEQDLYVLTNSKRNYGAGAMLYKDVMKRFADLIGDDLYILPSSICEVMLTAVSAVKHPEKLKEMVGIVNAEYLRPEEILSDNVYRFTRATGEITIKEADHE